MNQISNNKNFYFKLLDWWNNLFKMPSYAEVYLAKSIDRADFDYREKYLKNKGML